MSQKQAAYETAADDLAESGHIEDAVEMLGRGYNDQPAAIIDPPRTLKALHDRGLTEYRAWGWVKMSAKFIAHLKPLKGAKLAIWQCIALSIDETGTCKMTLKEIGALTDYSHTEVISSLKELEGSGYLTINKDGKTNIYQPVFVARGDEKPQETLVKKLDSTPQNQYESSPAIGNSTPSIKRVKRVNTNQDLALTEEEIEKVNAKVDAILDMANFEGAKREARVNAILSYLGETFHKNTEMKEWREFAKYIDGEKWSKGWDVKDFVKWLYSQKNFDLQYWPVKKMYENYPAAFVKSNIETKSEYPTL